MKKMKKFLNLLILFLGVCILKTNLLAQNLDKIRVAYHPNFGGASAIITGIKEGYFKENGIDVELVKFTSGPPEIAAMMSGDIQIGYIGFGAHTLAVDGKVKIIATDGLATREGIRTRKKNEIKSVEDLKGKTLATQLGTSGETIIAQVLNESGVERKDIKILNMEIQVAIAAFLSNKVDAIAVWPPYTVQIDERLGDELVEIKGNGSDKDVESTASWVVTPKYLEENEDIVIRFTKALYKAMDYRKNNMNKSIEYVSKLIGVDLEIVEKEKYSSNWMDTNKAKLYLENGTFKKIYERHQEYFWENKRLAKKPGPIENYVNLEMYNKILMGDNYEKK
ncbi:MAG: ABC transporter substrate-binding protein [Cetobacterium sp.]